MSNAGMKRSLDNKPPIRTKVLRWTPELRQPVNPRFAVLTRMGDKERKSDKDKVGSSPTRVPRAILRD